MASALMVGIDIGGTFTDVVAIDTATGDVRSAKVRSRPEDPVQSVEAAFQALLRRRLGLACVLVVILAVIVGLVLKVREIEHGRAFGQAPPDAGTD